MSYLRPYCHVNALGHDWQGVLKRDLENCKDEVLAQSVKKKCWKQYTTMELV